MTTPQDLAALVAALRAQRQIDMDGCEVAVSRQACDEAADTITALAEENRRLREALKPFAKAGKLFPGSPGSVEFDLCIYRPAAGSEWSLCGDDLRRARSALSSTGEKG